MLTKTDLNKIRKIVREEVETEAKNTQEELQGEIKLARIEIQKELGTLKDIPLCFDFANVVYTYRSFQNREYNSIY